MATVVLQYAGAALGSLVGGPLGGTIGRAMGGIAGAVIDQELFGATSHREGPRLNALQLMASQEGAAIPVVYGRMRVAGQVIWATNLLEVPATTSSGGGKGGSSSASSTTTYSYFANFAVGLCEGEIQGIGRCWADGKEIDVATFAPRIYLGSETQLADSLITTIEGAANVPAYRGLAYVVFERLPLAKFGNRLPQLSFEVFAKGNDVASLVQAVNIIPGATEFGYDTALVSKSGGTGITLSENAHVSASHADWSVSMDQLQRSCRNIAMASLVVAWFGNDLRCAQCQLKPGTDDPAKVTTGGTWNVSGITRGQAHQVSAVNGLPAFGGTPSDASVIHAIQDLKARGLKVMFYPFILMDVAQGNALPDPYGGSAQGAYPWRGRITANLAPGQAGTPDKTATAATQISTFVGSASATQFTASGTTINYAGSEWSYRRMVLHYAKLCALAGGVDGFLIGSELRGLTTLRSSANTFPFVAALQTLAADVKAILPSAKISYAADWSEYAGYHPSDASNDHYFHLDPLWSATAVDFIGIDNYFPLSDWRDGTSHLDYLAGAPAIYDQIYLQSRIASGENYDWYYASQSDRDTQTRTPITDGTYNKSWIFRAKDLKNWWLNQHFNRPSGTESPSATAWVPQSKPFWFTEIGCPAIDKGSNQPNAFVDAKSIESTLPYYSGGQPDAQMQFAFIKAVQNYWAAGGATNPVSLLYGTTMIDPARLFYWCWDARPYPAFPARSDVWGDGANYARGHWLNGRLNGVELATLITALAARFGLADIDVSAVEGIIDGFVLDRPMSAREALENLLQTQAIDCFESLGQLKFASRRRAPTLTLSTADLVDDDKASALMSRHRAQETDLPASIRVAFAESGLDYRQSAVSQLRSTTSSKNEVSLTIPAAITFAEAQKRADVLLAETWIGRESANFNLPPRFEQIEPGDVIAINNNLWRVKSLMAGATRVVEALAHDPAVYDPPPAPDRGVSAPPPVVYGQADIVMMDLALADANGDLGPRVAVHASPWPGSEALYRKTSTASFTFNALLSQQAVMATTLTTLNSGNTARIDWHQTIDVKMRSGVFTSISIDEVLGGGNLIAVGTAATGFELMQFNTATLIAAGTYRLAGLLRAQAGSEPEMLSTRPAGQDVVLLDSAIIQAQVSNSEAALQTNWHLGPPQLDIGNAAYADVSFTGALKPLRPLLPTYFRMKKDPAGLLISWIRRTRLDGDSWDLAEVPLSEVSESYRLDILKASVVVRSLSPTQNSYLYLTSDILNDFGSVPASFVARISQISAAYGQGAILERTLNA